MEPRWPEMAVAARQVWYDWFADEVLFDRIGDAIAAIIAERTVPEFVAQRIPSPPEWEWRLRRGIRHVRSYFSASRTAQHENSLPVAQKLPRSHGIRVVD